MSAMSACAGGFGVVEGIVEQDISESYRAVLGHGHKHKIGSAMVAYDSAVFHKILA